MYVICELYMCKQLLIKWFLRVKAKRRIFEMKSNRFHLIHSLRSFENRSINRCTNDRQTFSLSLVAWQHNFLSESIFLFVLSFVCWKAFDKPCDRLIEETINKLSTEEGLKPTMSSETRWKWFSLNSNLRATDHQENTNTQAAKLN